MSQQFTEEGMDAVEKALDATGQLGDRIRELEQSKAELLRALKDLHRFATRGGMGRDSDLYSRVVATIAKAEAQS